MNKVRGVLNIALQVHMTTRGTYERSHETGVNDQDTDVKFLRRKVHSWIESDGPGTAFDNACKQVLIEAIREYEEANGLPISV